MLWDASRASLNLLIKKCLSIFYVGLRNVFVGVELNSDVEQLLTEPSLQDISSGRDARDYSPNMMALTLTGQRLYVNLRELALMLWGDCSRSHSGRGKSLQINRPRALRNRATTLSVEYSLSISPPVCWPRAIKGFSDADYSVREDRSPKERMMLCVLAQIIKTFDPVLTERRK